MKVLFLDIDGVVNSMHTKERFQVYIGIDTKLTKYVKQIIKRTQCKVVLSSIWRLDAEFRDEVRAKVTDFIDVTPRLGKERGYEIEDWLRKHPEVETYAILDDNSDMLEGQALFLTDWRTGITPDVRDRVIAYLNGEEPYRGRIC